MGLAGCLPSPRRVSAWLQRRQRRAVLQRDRRQHRGVAHQGGEVVLALFGVDEELGDLAVVAERNGGVEAVRAMREVEADGRSSIGKALAAHAGSPPALGLVKNGLFASLRMACGSLTCTASPFLMALPKPWFPRDRRARAGRRSIALRPLQPCHFLSIATHRPRDAGFGLQVDIC